MHIFLLQYKEIKGDDLEITLHGKPYEATFTCAKEKLETTAGDALDRIYMVGDNPLSDIMGANTAGGAWESVLVRTGCFKGEDNDTDNPAKYVFDNVQEAVEALLKKHSVESDTTV